MGDYVVFVNGHPKFSVPPDDPYAKQKCEAEAIKWRQMLSGQGDCEIVYRQVVKGDLIEADFARPK